MRILIADDDESIRGFLAACFEGNSQYTVTIVASGEEALDKIGKGEHFDLLLTDNDMGKTSGTDIAPIIKDWIPYVKIILMSGKDVSIEGLPIDYFLHKPFSFPLLLKKIKELVE